MNLSQKVAFNTVVLVLSRLFIAASGLVGVIVATRYLGRDAFGQLTSAVVFVTIVGFLTDAGLWTVAAREIAKRPEDEDRIMANIAAIGVLLSASAIVVALVVMFVVYPGHDHALVRAGVAILAIQFAFAAPGGVGTAYNTAHQLAVPAAVGSLLASVAFVACLVATTSADLGFDGVAAAYAIVGIVNITVPFAFVLRRRRVRIGLDTVLARQLLRWMLAQGALLAAGVIYLRVDTVLLSLLGTNGDVAEYGLGYRVVDVLTLGPLFLMTTLFPEIARAHPRSDRLQMLVQAAWSTITLLALPVVVLLIGLAPQIVAVAGGRQFHSAATVLELLSLALALTFFNQVYLNALVALNQQALLVRIVLGVLAVNIALNFALIPPLAARGAAIALIASEALLFVFGRRLYAKLGEQPRIPRPTRLVVAALAVVAIVAPVRLFVDRGLSAPAVTLILTGAAALAVYALVLHLAGGIPPELRDSLAQLRRPREPAAP